MDKQDVEEIYEKIILMMEGAIDGISEEETFSEMADGQVKNWISNTGFQKGLKKLFMREFGLRSNFVIKDSDDEFANESFEEYKKRIENE